MIDIQFVIFKNVYDESLNIIMRWDLNPKILCKFGNRIPKYGKKGCADSHPGQVF
jgi:hypothetical protein